jgi:hypothetical protein
VVVGIPTERIDIKDRTLSLVENIEQPTKIKDIIFQELLKVAYKGKATSDVRSGA